MKARRTKLVLTLLGLGLSLGAGLLLYERFIAARPEQVSPEHLALGRGVYQTHCAACHGADLEGQPNWRQRGADGLLPAPPAGRGHPARLGTPDGASGGGA